MFQTHERAETRTEPAVLYARLLLGGLAPDRERYVAAQGHGRLLPLRARQPLVLDGLLHVTTEPQVHDLQSQQPVTGEWYDQCNPRPDQTAWSDPRQDNTS